jgi:hypothetical protein
VTKHTDAQRLLQERVRHPAQRDSGRRLPSAGSLQNRPRFGKVVLLHSHEIGVAWSRSGERRAPCLSFELVRRDRIGGHHRLPLGPLAVPDLNRDWATLRLAVPDAAQDGDRVRLELHPSATAKSKPAAG